MAGRLAAARIIIFSDFACPFCYVTEAALRLRAAEGGVEIEYRAFELHPVPAPLPASREPAEANAALRSLAREAGVSLDRQGPATRTRKAHEAARAARVRDLEDELRDAIFAAYWAEERDVGRIDVLVEIGRGLGMDPSELKVALDIDQFTDAVLGDEAAALQLGVQSVPTLIVSSGAAGATPQVRVGAQSYVQIAELIARR